MFNLQGSEMIFLVLIALVVLGPEKLPEAVRKFTKTYAEFKKTVGGFQTEFRDAMDEPMRELRETANAVRDAAKFDLDLDAKGGDASAMEKLTPPVSGIAPKTPTTTTPAAVRNTGLNFGGANPRRQERVARSEAPADTSADAPADVSTDAPAEGPAVAEGPVVDERPVVDAAPTEDATE